GSNGLPPRAPGRRSPDARSPDCQPPPLPAPGSRTRRWRLAAGRLQSARADLGGRAAEADGTAATTDDGTAATDRAGQASRSPDTRGGPRTRRPEGGRPKQTPPLLPPLRPPRPLSRPTPSSTSPSRARSARKIPSGSTV